MHSSAVGLAHLRVARPTDNLEAVVKFYRDGLGFDVLYEFRDHDGFDGVMLGRRGTAYHLEFTRRAGHRAGRAPTEDNRLVFYLPVRADWDAVVPREALDEIRVVTAWLASPSGRAAAVDVGRLGHAAAWRRVQALAAPGPLFAETSGAAERP